MDGLPANKNIGGSCPRDYLTDGNPNYTDRKNWSREVLVMKVSLASCEAAQVERLVGADPDMLQPT
jgi:hypothetical protein